MGHKLRYCENCGDVIRPDIVLYGEMLDQPTVFRALDKIQKADTVIVLGSSLVVQPAAGFISNFTGDNLVIINRDATSYDRQADLVIHNDMTEVVDKYLKINIKFKRVLGQNKMSQPILSFCQ